MTSAILATLSYIRIYVDPSLFRSSAAITDRFFSRLVGHRLVRSVVVLVRELSRGGHARNFPLARWCFVRARFQASSAWNTGEREAGQRRAEIFPRFHRATVKFQFNTAAQ